jgi:tricorn protease
MMNPKPTLAYAFVLLLAGMTATAQSTLLLRQPSLSATHIAFTYGGDIWLTDRNGKNVQRITSTPAVESDPHLSPDGKWIAFSSNRSGNVAVYIVAVEGGTPRRLTWYPEECTVRGWAPDGKNILYATSRNAAPTGFNRLWSVSVNGGPSRMLSAQWGNDGSYSPDGTKLIIDRLSRWDVEWRNYRGGQNTPLVILNLADQTEKLLPYASTVDIEPLWLGEHIYFISDRDWISNIWRYTPSSNELKQITSLTGSDIKTMDGFGDHLIFERDGRLNLLNLGTNETTAVNISIQGDFPWAETKWQDVTSTVARCHFHLQGNV